MMPKFKGGNAGTYLFGVVCFFIGLGIVTLFSLGQIRVDDRDGPGWSPITTMPDGKLGLSEFATSTIGFGVLMAFGWLVTQIH